MTSILPTVALGMVLGQGAFAQNPPEPAST